MNRFFRSAFFPLIVIVLLVWLASQTLIPKSSNAHKLTTSDAIRDVTSGQVTEAVFNPGKRSIALKLSDGSKKQIAWPASVRNRSKICGVASPMESLRTSTGSHPSAGV